MSEDVKRSRIGRSLVLLVVFALLAFGLPAVLRLVGAHEWLLGFGLGEDAFTWLFVFTGAVLVVLITMALRRRGLFGATQALGLWPLAPQGLAVSALALLVMALAATSLGHPFQVPALSVGLSLGLIGPFAEELLFRGFLFRQARDWAGLPFWIAATLSSLLFGIGHWSQGDTLATSLQAGAVSFVGGVLFCWLVERWGSLWPAILLHAGMDLLWLCFLLADSAIGGRVGNLARLAALAVVIVGTLALTRRRKA
jgi:hypothetical protein